MEGRLWRSRAGRKGCRVLCCLLLCGSLREGGAQNARPAKPKEPSRPVFVAPLPRPTVEETGVVRNQRFLNGIPFGGIGTGTFQVMTDGAISHATLNNNPEQPTGDLPGSFAAVWTNAGGRTVTRVLRLKGAGDIGERGGLPFVSDIAYTGQFPQALLDYPDPSLPLKLSLRVYSPLIPHDLRNSSLPVALFVFTLKNDSRAPVQASVALSWENILGVGGISGKPLDDRTGNKITVLPVQNGLFGLQFSAPDRTTLTPEDRLRFNATGNYTLMAQPLSADTLVTQAGWNARDPVPNWWKTFVADGSVTGEVGAGGNRIAPAGVIAVKVDLKAWETREIPFAVAWYTPRWYTTSGAEYGHLYEKGFRDSTEIAAYALKDRLNLLALTEEWQGRLLRSSLPLWLSRRIINDASPLFTDTVLTRDSGLGEKNPGPALFASLEPDGKRTPLGALEPRAFFQTLLLAWFPRLDREELARAADNRAANGLLASDAGTFQTGFAPPGETKPTDTTAACHYVLQIYRYYLSAGDRKFLDQYYPSVKRAAEYLVSAMEKGDLPPSVEADGGLRLAALRIARLLALRIGDTRFATLCDEAFISAQKRLFPRLTTEPERLASLVMSQGLADSLEAGDLVPSDTLSTLFAALPEARQGLSLAQAAFWTRRGSPDALYTEVKRAHQLLYTEQKSLIAPPGRLPGLSAAAGWMYLNALAGFGLDVPAGRMTLTPRLPTAWKGFTVPLFAAQFTATLEYRTGLNRISLVFRLDRQSPLPQEGGGLTKGGLKRTGFTLNQVILPASPTASGQVIASLDRAPLPGKITHDAQGRLLFTFDSALLLTPGQRLEFVLR